MRILWLVLMMLMAAPGPAASKDTYEIGFLSLSRDVRYDRHGDHPGDMGKLKGFYPLGRPQAGAELAIREARPLKRSIGVELKLTAAAMRTGEKAIAEAKKMFAGGIDILLLDLPADTLSFLRDAFNGAPQLLINVSETADRFRNEECAGNLLHTAPSNAMLMDGLAQYLLFKKWTDILILEGPDPLDAQTTAAFQRAVERYGLTVQAHRNFILSNNPRAREQNRLGLLTANADYDVVFVADIDRNFSYQVPYRIMRPRPVVGAAGLRPKAWSWSWTRHGAPQLNSRFEALHKRRMTGPDWSAWFAVKAITEALLRTKSTKREDLIAYITATDARFDGFKGGGYSFRLWNGQLRQHVLADGGEWVAEVAPMDAFLHAKNNLDTLGYDEPESACARNR